jgi:hypothetical protein
MADGLIFNENLFLIIIGLIWIIGAVIQDIRRREVDNIWNFSLIAFALAYRALVSVYNQDYWYLVNGIIGFGVFFALANLFYYSRLFAGGDAKLLMALGTILPFSYNWISNLKIFGIFIFLFFIFGSVYSLIYSFVLVFMNKQRFSKEFAKQYKIYKKMFFYCIIFVVFLIIFVFLVKQTTFVLFGLVVLLFPILFIFAKSIEEACMVKLILPRQVTEGDWLYKDIKLKGKVIKSNWEGISKRELELIRKSNKKILIKQGIPFTPSFLFGFIGLLILIYYVVF